MRDRYVKRPEDEQTIQAALHAVEKKQLPHMLCVTNMLLHGIEDPSFVRHDNTLAPALYRLGEKGQGLYCAHQSVLRRAQTGGISSAAAIHNLGAEAIVVSCRLMKEGTVLEEVEIDLAANG